MRDLLREVLSLAGHSVDCCADPSELMALLDRQTIDVLILDLVLGERQEQRGLQLLTELRDSPQYRLLPVLVLSADLEALREHAPELEAMPATDVLLKPFAVGELEDAVHRLRHPNLQSAMPTSAPNR